MESSRYEQKKLASSRHYPSHSFAPSAPELPPESYGPHHQRQQETYSDNHHGSSPSYSYYGQHQQQPSYGQSGFPAGTHPDVVRAFQMVDRDRSGFIDENELQQALSSGYERFNIRTIRLLMFLFKNPHDSLRIGPREFAALWSCLGHWRAIFERFDRDRSGKIDLMELRDALYSLGYAIPPSVLQVLISKYDNGSGRKVELNFDSFVECGMIVKGLTEKFKEKDPRYTGSATLTYDSFMSIVIPFLVSYD
ncbi:probable calcium-binding protein CML48 [Durio zibethinus]|uniref:Probable calcium-binding protein CML48 n=1 Tax=Durio zibethinus TaxID=66656 RepID=A0A6P5XVK5_DURZI|nr:probable calcium-binding protein CML48 [Durio zibethinus]